MNQTAIDNLKRQNRRLLGSYNEQITELQRENRYLRKSWGWMSALAFILAGICAGTGAMALVYFTDMTATAVFYLLFMVCVGFGYSLRKWRL